VAEQEESFATTIHIQLPKMEVIQHLVKEELGLEQAEALVVIMVSIIMAALGPLAWCIYLHDISSLHNLIKYTRHET
jgi:hypothetical protein